MAKNIRVNNEIDSAEVRVINQNGDMLGVYPIEEALKLAKETGEDLIEVSPKVSPPVCKIIGYGKYKYLLQKRQSEVKKKQKIVEQKEIKLGHKIEEHDYQTKLKKIINFLKDDCKVRVSMRFRGREIFINGQKGIEIMKKVIRDTADISKVDVMPSLNKETRLIIMELSLKKV